MTEAAMRAELSDAECDAIRAHVYGNDPPVCDDMDEDADRALVRAGYRAGASRGVAPPDDARDRDWILAMAAALGTDSGFHVPIAPTKEAFAQLFAAVRGVAPPREPPTAREALAELVACKDLIDSIGPEHSHEMVLEIEADYKRRKPLAWNAARRVLAEPEQEASCEHGFHNQISATIGGSVRCGTCGAIVTAPVVAPAPAAAAPSDEVGQMVERLRAENTFQGDDPCSCRLPPDPNYGKLHKTECAVMVIHDLRVYCGRAAALLLRERERADKEEREHDATMGERDRMSDALLDASMAMGGPEWCGRLPPQEPPESGDLVLDVPVLCKEIVSRAEQAESERAALAKELAAARALFVDWWMEHHEDSLYFNRAVRADPILAREITDACATQDAARAIAKDGAP